MESSCSSLPAPWPCPLVAPSHSALSCPNVGSGPPRLVRSSPVPPSSSLHSWSYSAAAAWPAELVGPTSPLCSGVAVPLDSSLNG